MKKLQRRFIAVAFRDVLALVFIAAALLKWFDPAGQSKDAWLTAAKAATAAGNGVNATTVREPQGARPPSRAITCWLIHHLSPLPAGLRSTHRDRQWAKDEVPMAKETPRDA